MAKDNIISRRSLLASIILLSTIIGIIGSSSCLVMVDAFSPSITSHNNKAFSVHTSFPSGPFFPLFATGGFGGSSSNSDTNSKKSTPLKPKQQWDRYLAMKDATKYRVAVRKEQEAATEWMCVGAVKSGADVTVDVAVARQRSLIADHAHRLFPLQISKQDKLEWAYEANTNSENDDTADSSWSTIIPKDISLEAGVEKKVGFEGIAHAASGYYCVYNQGRRVTATDTDPGKEKSESKRASQGKNG